jgi:glycosyltransferase involved in cell wall biosynthesis
MRVLNVNFSLDLKIGTGTAERTFQMSRFLARRGVQCAVLTLDLGLDAARIAAIAPATVVGVPSLWKRFNVPRIRWKTVRRLVAEANVVHLMGHWSVLNAIVYLAARRAGKPYVVCPAGALPIFGRSRWLKRLYNLVVGYAIVRNASAWIAVTSGEFPHFESYGIPSHKVTVIPNGVCEEDFPMTDTKAFLTRHALPDAPVILFMGRLNLIKGPDLLLDAFILAYSLIPEYHLVFAGADDGMQSMLRDVVEQKGLTDNVHFIGHVDGDDKSAAYRCAKLLVVPSRQEAMSIVALEAGICGTPALLTDQCGFSGICLLDSRLEVPATADGIADGLIRLLTDSTILDQVAPKWREFVEREYSWNVVVSRYIDLYAACFR